MHVFLTVSIDRNFNTRHTVHELTDHEVTFDTYNDCWNLKYVFVLIVIAIVSALSILFAIVSVLSILTFLVSGILGSVVGTSKSE